MSLDASAVRELFREAGVKDKILAALGDGASLSDGGVDSLDFANVLLAIEERHGVKIPDEDALSLDSFDALAGYVNRRLG